MKKIIKVIIACTLCAGTFLFAQEQQEQLAEVLVLPFANETGKKEYEWLSKNIPNAIVDSMKEKFRFNLITRDRFEEIVLLSKTKEIVLYRPHTDEKEIVKISKVVNADIIIYGKYIYNKEEKIINVNAYIYHRSREKTTGTIEMITPITSEMFKIVDKVADSVIEHIATVAKEDAEAAKKAGEKITSATPKDIKSEKITLVKREAKISKSYRILAGGGFGGGLGYFEDITKPGPSAMFGIIRNEKNFWHAGISISAIQLLHNENTEKNIIEELLFIPIILEGGLNIRTDFFTTFQLFTGLGLSIDTMRVGEEKIFVNNAALRDETNKRFWYVNPTAMFGMRLPISLGSFAISPYLYISGYTGTTVVDERKYGYLIVGGILILW